MGFVVDIPEGTLREAWELFENNKKNSIDDNGYSYALWNYRNEMRAIQVAKDGNCYCGICGDTGIRHFLFYENGRYYNQSSICKCNDAAAVKQAIMASGLANEVSSKNFKNFETTEDYQKVIKNIAKEYLGEIVRNKKTWFYIGGQTGAGKSHICIAIANRFFQNNCKLQYVRWIYELRSIKSDMNNTERISKMKNAEVLYIDDLFKGGATNYEISLAFEVINYRDCNKLITIISSELLPEDLKEVDNAIYGRIVANTGDKYIVRVSRDENKNYRLKGKQNELFGGVANG